MNKVDSLILVAKNQIKRLVPNIMAVFVAEIGSKVKKTTCYYSDGNGYSKEELLDNTKQVQESLQLNNNKYPVIRFVKASEIFKMKNKK